MTSNTQWCSVAAEWPAGHCSDTTGVGGIQGTMSRLVTTGAGPGMVAPQRLICWRARIRLTAATSWVVASYSCARSCLRAVRELPSR